MDQVGRCPVSREVERTISQIGFAANIGLHQLPLEVGGMVVRETVVRAKRAQNRSLLWWLVFHNARGQDEGQSAALVMSYWGYLASVTRLLQPTGMTGNTQLTLEDAAYWGTWPFAAYGTTGSHICGKREGPQTQLTLARAVPCSFAWRTYRTDGPGGPVSSQPRSGANYFSNWICRKHWTTPATFGSGWYGCPRDRGPSKKGAEPLSLMMAGIPQCARAGWRTIRCIGGLSAVGMRLRLGWSRMAYPPKLLAKVMNAFADMREVLALISVVWPQKSAVGPLAIVIKFAVVDILMYTRVSRPGRS